MSRDVGPAGAVGRDFVWRDAGRTVVFRRGAIAAAPALLAQYDAGNFELLSTSRALGELDGAVALASAATKVNEISSGQVPTLAANLLAEFAFLPGMREERRTRERGRALVALGGGRVVDVAKAVASVTGAAVVAIPTTMSGAEMTAIHRLPAGAEDRVAGMVRPALVLADPEAMTGQPEPRLRASSMNALAHGADSLYTPLSNPVSEMTALRGAELIASALDQPPVERDRAALALGSLLCGYAIDSAGFGLHHVICQTLVRLCGTPHAETNAAILPHAVAFLAERAPERFAELAATLGTDPPGLAGRIAALGQPVGLGDLGADRATLAEAVAAMLQRLELASVPGPALIGEDLRRLVNAAW